MRFSEKKSIVQWADRDQTYATSSTNELNILIFSKFFLDQPMLRKMDFKIGKITQASPPNLPTPWGLCDLEPPPNVKMTYLASFWADLKVFSVKIYQNHLNKSFKPLIMCLNVR